MLVDETFYSPRTPVSVVAVGDSGEALLVRSLLENLGATVAMHLIGTPEDFLRVIGQGSAAPSWFYVATGTRTVLSSVTTRAELTSRG
jgi:hypothetical protein